AQCLAFLLICHAIQSEQVGDIAVLESHPARLQPADLRMGCADRFSRVFHGDALGLTQAPKLRPEQYAQNCWPPRGRDNGTPGLAADRFGSFDHVPSPVNVRPRKSPTPRGPAL